MLAKISAGNDSLRFPQVTGGIFPSPAVKLGEAFIVPFKSAFFKKRREKDVPFYPVANTLTKVTTCCFEVNGEPFKFDFVSKKLICSLLALQSLIQKKQLAEKIFTTIKLIGNWLLSLFRFSLIPTGEMVSSKSRSWS